MKAGPSSLARRVFLLMCVGATFSFALPVHAERAANGRRIDPNQASRQERMVPIRRDDGNADGRDDRRGRRLSEEERRQLRRDVRDAERDFYRDQERRRR